MRRLLPLLLLLFATQAWGADTVVCGDDDNSGTQSKLKSPGLIDRDCDGQVPAGTGTAVDTDCDDTLFFVHDKSYSTDGCNAGFYRYCEAGVYKTGVGGATTNANGGQGCTNTTLAERGTNYYFDYGTGNNANYPCTAGSPCKDFTDFNPGGAHASYGANKAFYVMGTTDWTTAIARTPDGGDGSTFVGFSTDQAGTSAGSKNIVARYPTSTAKLNFGNCDATHECKSFKIAAQHWAIRGFEVTGGYTDPIKREASDIEIYDNYTHDVPGDDNHNHSGINAFDGLSDGWIHHNIINNVYDPTRTLAGSDRQNISAISIFYGSNNIAEYNLAGYNHAINSAPLYVQGRGIRRKHGTTLGNYTQPNIIRNNVLYNTEMDCVHAVDSLDQLTGNLCYSASNCFTVSDGGATPDKMYIDDIRIKNNTCKSFSHDTGVGFGGGAISFRDPSFLTAYPVTNVQVTGNVIDDSAQTSYSTSDDMFMLFYNGSAADRTALITGGKFTVNSNCYYNSAIAALTSGFNVISAGGGSVVNFAHWLSDYAFPTNEFNENPAFDTDMQATSVNCTGKGWVAAWPTVTTTTTTTTLPTGRLPSLFPQN